MRLGSRWFALALASAAFIAGCGGSSISGSSSISTTPQPQPSAGAPATLHVSVEVGGNGTSVRARPHYVSSNTQSVAIALVSVNGVAVSGQSATIVQTFAGASDCAANGTGRTCSQDIKTIAGTDVFSVTLFSAPNATGTALASGFITSNVASTGSSLPITNATSISLTGVVANIAVSVVPASLTFGVAGSAQVVLNATDASGATIIAPGSFSSPITLTTSDGTGSFGFTTSSTTTPSSQLSVTSAGTQVNLVYNGSQNTVPGQLTVTASLGTTLQAFTQLQLVVAATSTPSTSPSPSPSGSPGQPTSLLYVLNAGASGNGRGATITEFGNTASGNMSPYRTLNLSSSLYAAGIAVDGTGNVFVGYYDQAPLGNTYQADLGNEIDEYPAGSFGNAAPSRRLLGDPVSNTYLDPGVLVVDSAGRITTPGDMGGIGYDTILTYAAGATGAVAPSNSYLAASNFPELSAFSYYATPTNGYTAALTEDASGNLYQTGSFYLNPNTVGTIEIAPSNFYTDSSQSSTPARYITSQSSLTKLANDATDTSASPHDIQGLALDSTGTIFESQIAGAAHSPSINVYSAGAFGGKTNVPPLRTITSPAFPQTDTSNAVGVFPIAINGTTLYAVNRTSNSILLFPTSASGSSTPSATISGAATLLQSPMAIESGPLAGPGHATAIRKKVLR